MKNRLLASSSTSRNPPTPEATPAATCVVAYALGGFRERHAADLGIELPAPVVHAEEEIRFGGSGVQLLQVLRPDRLDRGAVHVVVPVRGDLLARERAAGVQHQVVSVDLDVLDQLQVTGRLAEADDSFRTRGAEPAVLHEDALLFRVDELHEVGVRRQCQRAVSSVTSASIVSIRRCRAIATR